MSTDGTARIWDVARRECVLELSVHRSIVDDCHWISDSELWTTGHDRLLRVWHVEREVLRARLQRHVCRPRTDEERGERERMLAPLAR